MSQLSNIEWTDATWNPVRGCTKVSPGCKHCYAETFAERFRGVKGHPYEQGFDLRLVPEKLTEPLTWKKPRRVFVNSMSDLFQDDVPDSYINQVFAVMALAPDHTFQVLTKRAERMRDYLGAPNRHDAIVSSMDMPPWLPPGRRFLRVPENWPMPNVWLGVSVENQHFADERIPVLLQTPAAVRFISAEPLLGPVRLYRFVTAVPGGGVDPWTNPLDWVIVGGESGPGARRFDVAWARSIVEQCKAADVSVFVKQMGGNVIDRNDAGFTGDFDGSGTCWPEQHAIDDRIEDNLDGTRDGYQGAPVRIHMISRKGGDPSEWPEDLRVREFPKLGRA